jgi:Na+-translocating ferredoxin:NAD+ oxidoreductase RnfG subunit
VKKDHGEQHREDQWKTLIGWFDDLAEEEIDEPHSDLYFRFRSFLLKGKEYSELLGSSELDEKEKNKIRRGMQEYVAKNSDLAQLLAVAVEAAAPDLFNHLSADVQLEELEK